VTWAADIVGDQDKVPDNMLWAEDEFFGMGTVITNKVYGEHAEDAIRAARDETDRLEGILSRFIPASDIGRLNAAAGTGCVQLSPEAYEVLSWAVRFSECSRGRFDITVAPLIALWSEAKEIRRPPVKERIAETLKLVNYTDVILDGGDSAERTAMLRRAGQAVDLGGIGKGFAADRILDTYRTLGITSAFTNFGGNVAVLGTKPDGSPWNIGIQHPRKADSLIGAISVTDRSVVTSGDYQRYFTGADEKRYHHILDPECGYPAESGLISATVVCQSSMAADALSTALFVTGIKNGFDKVLGMLGCFPGAEAVLIDINMTIYVTGGLWGNFRACEDIVVKLLEPV
jgi:thiamine biosynthesis lipoprotein